MVALALMVSCMPSAYTISASEAFGDGTEDIFTDGEITSEPAAEESTPDVSSADQEETEQAQQSTLTYENDSVKVTAEALEDGALPQNTALKADGVNENSSVSYDTVSQKLSAAATDKGSSLRGFFAYDVYFADGDGNRVEPNGRVRITFEYKTPAAPELTDAASTSVTVEKLHYNSSTGDTDVNTLQANEDLKVLNVNEGKQIQTLQVETGNAAVFAVMWDSPETADVEAEAVSGNEDEVPIASEELTDGMDISDEPEQDAAETPAAENPEVTPEAEPSEEPAVEPTEAPAENPDAEPTEAPAEDPDVVEEPAEDIASPEDVPAADENGETSLIEVLGDDTNLRVSPSIEAEVLATVNAGTQLTLLDTVTAEDGATWYKVSWEGTEAYIRSDMAQVVDSSDEAEEPEDVQEEEIQPEITRYDYTSDEVNVKVTLTDPADLPDNAELSVTPVELSQEAEDQITEEAIKEKKAIEKIHSYDIKFLVDGEEVQPGATVKVSVSLNDEKKIKDADVYHVDENDNVENMDGSVAKNGDVEFETTHFSTYVIVGNKRDDKIKVTIEHYDATTGEKIYADDVDKELSVGQKFDCKKATNWDIKEVKVVIDGKENTVAAGDIELAQDATVKVYYTPTTGTFAGAPTFYDYTVKAGQSGNTYYSINQKSNYSDPDSNQKLSMGETHNGKLADQNYEPYQYTWQKGNKTVNLWTGGKDVITDLLKGLDENGNVEFNYPDPGFFNETDLLAGNSKDNYLRKVYKDYNLNFERSGDTYTLTGVTDGSGTNVTTQYKLNKKENSGEDFFPLDTVASKYEKGYTRKTQSVLGDDGKEHNYYFGMRYDMEFNIGDYVGPLNYSFTGDDDMWVVMDGGKKNQQIIIDLGGIHNAATKTVNLRDYLPKGDTSTHTLTVLYMERGAGASNCYMNFTLPNVTISQVTTDALGTLNFQKVNKEGAGLSGARFALYNDEECTTQIATATSDDSGKVTFDKLRAGTYYLKEIQAPVGYVASNEKWTVTVTKENNNVTTTLKNSSGTAVKDNKILNETPEEIINSSMVTSKTAKVKDWDQRTYDITINATSTSTSSIIETGGTDPAVGLEDAKNKLDAMVDTNPKYVVLFTDGKPTGGGNKWNSNAQKNAETQAGELKTGLRNNVDNAKNPYTVYTIGFALNDEGDRAKTFLSGGTYDGEKYPGIASSSDCAKTADDAASLTQIFQSISSTINKNVDITGATITDVIDSRFEIVDRGNVITETNFEGGKYTLENGGIVTKRNDGTYQVQWTDQTIKHTTDGTNGWSRTITVKAKDSFIGGNNIPTNVSPDSKISVGDLKKVLDQPTVNVKVNLVVKDKEITIYKGDSVPMDEQIRNELFATSKPTSYKDGTVNETDSKKEDGTSLIKLQWFKKDNGVRTNIDESEIKPALNDGTEYYLEVTYTAPTESTDTSKTNTDGHFVGTETAKNPGNNNLYGIYKINVISGQIQIIKNVTEASTEARTFKFNVEDSDGNAVSGSPLKVIVEADQTSGVAKLENLPRGYYTVTEVEADGYTIQAFEVDGQTDCENSKSDTSKSLTFRLGYDTDKNNVIKNYTYKQTDGGVKGVASYTNEAVTKLDLKKTDTENHLLTGSEFNLEIKNGDNWKTIQNGIKVINGDSDIELTKLKSGIYRLTEIIAPKGYSILGSSICFKISLGKVELVNENGEAANSSEMWTLDETNKVLTIKNAKLYSLPESGGPGTYGFTISGVAILATALLLFIKNKRREEEAKRS